MTEELKPCPFCGAGNNEIMLFIEEPGCRLQCAGCNIEAPYFETYDKAAEAWNTRAALQDKAAEAGPKSIDWHAVTLSLDEAHDESLDGRHGVARAMLREVCANIRASLPTQPAAQAVPMTDEQMLACLAASTNEVPARIPPGWRKVMRAVEAHHGITAQGVEDKP